MFEKLKLLFSAVLGLNPDNLPQRLSDDQRKSLQAIYPKSLIDSYEQSGNSSELVSNFSQTEYFSEISAEAHKLLEQELVQKDALLETQRNAIELLSKEPVSAKTSVSTYVPAFSGYKINNSLKHNSTAIRSLAGERLLATANDIDVSELSSELSHVLKFNEKKSIHTSILTGFTSAKHFSKIHATSIYESSSYVGRSVLQKFYPGWNPAKGFKFIPYKTENRHHKIDVEFNPVSIINSWISFLYNESTTPDKMPITIFIVNELKRQILDDIEMKMIYKGEYRPLPEGFGEGSEATPPEYSCDGIETILIKEAAKDSSRFCIAKKSFDLSIATDDQVLTYFEEFYRAIPTRMRSSIRVAYLSHELLRRYRQAQDNKYNVHSGVISQVPGIAYILNTNIQLCPCEGMYDSPIIYATIDGNQKMLMNQNDVNNVIQDIQRNKRSVYVLGEMWFTPTFDVPEVVIAIIPPEYKIYLDTAVSAIVNKEEDLTLDSSGTEV